MKNIECDNRIILCGRQWVSNSYCFNYGYTEHGYEDDYAYTFTEETKINNRSGYMWNTYNMVSKVGIVDFFKRSFNKKKLVCLRIPSEHLRDILSEIDYDQHNNVLIYVIKNNIKDGWHCGIGLGFDNSYDFHYNLACMKSFTKYIDKKNVPDEKLIVRLDARFFKTTCKMYLGRKNDFSAYVNIRLYTDGKLIRIDNGEYNDDNDSVFTSLKTLNIDNYKKLDMIRNCLRSELRGKIFVYGLEDN